MRVVSFPDPDYSDRKHDHLWLLVGGGDYFDKSKAYYIGPDRDLEGDDIAGRALDRVIAANGLNAKMAHEALTHYRESISN